MSTPHTHPLTFEELERWTLFGGTWRVVALTAGHAEVELCTCSGEGVDRRETGDPRVIERLALGEP